MSHVYGYLAEQSAEDALHAERLLFIEERPFQRITRRLLGEESVLRTRQKQLPSPPPEDAVDEQPTQDDSASNTFARQKFREEVLLDFAALESSITRIQLIQSSNERERERYATEKAKILATSEAVRENTAQLREQLVDAQKVLELRKGYDTLAMKILVDRKLKSRDDARTDIALLEKEIMDLEAESIDADETWSTRRQNFDEYVLQGQAFLRAIKGIKEHAEDDEIMVSTVGTPRVDGSSTPNIETGSGTPLPVDSQDVEDDGQLPHSKLREASNVDTVDAGQAMITDDTQMGEVPEISANVVDGETMDES